MRRVIQKDESGCGLACVAMMTSRTYELVKRKAIAEGYVTAPNFSTDYEKLKRLAWQINGVRIFPKQESLAWDDLHEYSLLAVEKINPEEEHHWVMFRRKVSSGYKLILDPNNEVEDINYNLNEYKIREAYPVDLTGVEPWPWHLND